jgi:antirestriction protein ArdC
MRDELKDIRTKIERLYAPYPRNMRFVGDPPPKPDRRLRFIDDPPNLDRRNALVDEFIAATKAEIYERNAERDAGRVGSYSAKCDAIRMPAFEFFSGQADYYNTLFHELIHWTGHRSRLDRQLGARFGEESKAKEELIAELGAAFLCAEFSIIPASHADYIQDFFELLDEDPRELFSAVLKAKAAIDFLRQLSGEERDTTKKDGGVS